MTKPSRVFRVRMSERCYRFKPDALGAHAPKAPGVYEFVTFDRDMKPEVLYVGAALPGEGGTIYEALAAHMMGNVRPSAEDLFQAAADVYFDYVAESDASSPEDLRDIAGALVARHKPRLNPSQAPSSGRYASVTVEETD